MSGFTYQKRCGESTSDERIRTLTLNAGGARLCLKDQPQRVQLEMSRLNYDPASAARRQGPPLVPKRETAARLGQYAVPPFLTRHFIFSPIWAIALFFILAAPILSPGAVVDLPNVMTLCGLMDAEQTWFSSHYPKGFRIDSAGHPLRATAGGKIETDHPGVERAGEDQYGFSARGAARLVTFKYCLCPETNIADLWPNYMDHITAPEAQEIWLLDFHQFESIIVAMDIGSTLPYLIQQLDDARQAKIYPVYRKNRVCDLVAFGFFARLEFAKTGERIFPKIGQDLDHTPVARSEAETQRENVQIWWGNGGADLLKAGQLRWIGTR